MTKANIGVCKEMNDIDSISILNDEASAVMLHLNNIFYEYIDNACNQESA